MSKRRGRVIEGGAILLLLAGLIGGCTQGEGDRCQLDSDCGGNLRCCLPVGPLPIGAVSQRAVGGACTVYLLSPEGGVLQDKCQHPVNGDLGAQFEARVSEAGVKADVARDKTAATPDKPPAAPDAKPGQ